MRSLGDTAASRRRALQELVGDDLQAVERGAEEHRAVSYPVCKRQARLGVHACTCTRVETSERTDKKRSRRMEA